MPRPKGWKPLNYTTLATICGRLVRGDPYGDIVRDHGIQICTCRHLRSALEATGLEIKRATTLPEDLDSKINHLVRTTLMTNQQIRNHLALNGTHAVRARRRAYHKELRSAGLPVPRCKCGDDFQHEHRCGYWRTKGLRPFCDIDEAERVEIQAAWMAGTPKKQLLVSYQVSQSTLVKIIAAVPARQRKKRRLNYVSATRQSHQREAARADAAGLFARLGEWLARNVPPEVAEDVRQSMLVDILAGKLTEAQAKSRKREFVAKAYSVENNPWKTVSLDEELDDGLSLAERLEDEEALAAFDELESYYESDFGVG